MRSTKQNRQSWATRTRIAVGVMALLALPLVLASEEKKDQPAVTAGRAFQLSGYTHIIYSTYRDGLDTFTMRRARLTFSGEIAKNVKFKLQFDAVKSPILVDAQVDVQFRPEVALRFGQFYIPFGRESRTSASELETITRAQVIEKLGPGRDIGAMGRDIGAMVYGKLSIFEYMAGLFNGAGINKTDTNERKDFAARIVAQPVKFLSLGASLYSGRHSASAGAPEVTRDRTGFEAALNLGAFTLRGEHISGKDDQISRAGWFLQAAYFALPKRLQAVAKWDSYDQDADTADNRTDILTLGLNGFLSDKTKLMANYNWYGKEGEGTTNHGFSVQFQAGF